MMTSSDESSLTLRSTATFGGDSTQGVMALVAAGVPDAEVPISSGVSSAASDIPNLKRQGNEESLVTTPKSPRISNVVPLHHGPSTGSGAPSSNVF